MICGGGYGLLPMVIEKVSVLLGDEVGRFQGSTSIVDPMCKQGNFNIIVIKR